MKLPLALSALATLFGCNQTASNPSICGVIEDHVYPVAKDLSTATAIVQDCEIRWAYRFASGSVPIADAARATEIACAETLSARITYALAEDRRAGVEATIDGETEAERRDLADQAFMRAVQGRAGHCVAPDRNILTGDLEK